MKRILTMVVSVLTALISMEAAQPMKAPKGGKLISDELLGIFFEDISSSADGGLYAELVQNGSFEYNPNEKDGWGPATAWKVIRPGHSLGHIQPITTALPMKKYEPPYSSTEMTIFVERVKEYYDYKGWKVLHIFFEDEISDIKLKYYGNRIVMFVGTPCQVNALRCFLNKDYLHNSFVVLVVD